MLGLPTERAKRASVVKCENEQPLWRSVSVFYVVSSTLLDEHMVRTISLSKQAPIEGHHTLLQYSNIPAQLLQDIVQLWILHH